jgi:peptidylprolyl isomerase
MRLIALPFLLAALLFAACGSDDPSDETAATPTEAATEAPTETPTEAAAAPSGSVKVSGKVGEKPKVEVPGGDPPSDLVIKDIKKGHGPKAKPGQMVSVQYSGVLFSSGEPFDNSYDRGEPFSFQLGGGQVIPGWDQGLVGMQKGGRRVLTIPPDLAYGPNGSGPIGPNETLVFVVDMEEITSP